MIPFLFLILVNSAVAFITPSSYHCNVVTYRQQSTPVIHVPSTHHTNLNLYRKFCDYGWDKLMLGGGSSGCGDLDTVPEELRYNTSPAKGSPPGTDVVANIRSISQFPFLMANNDKVVVDDNQVLRLARSAFLETQTSTKEALISPMTIHVLNHVLFPSPHIRDIANSRFLGLPIFGADIVSLPGNKHLVALDFQPVLPLNEKNGDASLLPPQYSELESKLQKIHEKYQKSNSDIDEPLLAWGGDIPEQAERFFSPYALWTRLSNDDAIDTVQTVVWEAYKEYIDLYFELMNAVQSDIYAGKLEFAAKEEEANPVWDGQLEYLDYRRTNDPARPMLQRLYGNEWAESVIGDVLFPDP